jgi:ribosomal-protein-alanine N-acetyltransferase
MFINVSMTQILAQFSAKQGTLLTTRPLNLSDAEQVLALETAAHSHPWNAARVNTALEKYQGIGLLDGEKLVGFAFVMSVVGEAELFDFVVDPQCQGQGFGYAFIEWLVEYIGQDNARFFLEVRVSNKPAIAVYENVGFCEVGVRHNYYPAKKGREDALLMAIELCF